MTTWQRLKSAVTKVVSQPAEAKTRMFLKTDTSHNAIKVIHHGMDL